MARGGPQHQQKKYIGPKFNYEPRIVSHTMKSQIYVLQLTGSN